MPRHWLVVTVALLSVAGATETSRKDEETIRGTWDLTFSEQEGKREEVVGKEPMRLDFAADTFGFRLPGGAGHPQPYRIDAGQRPRTIDWLAGGKHGPSRPLLGIYERAREIMVERTLASVEALIGKA